ncbi:MULTISPECIES: pre-peptidase C-terminal domain-containing protein [Aeromonas]|uniref:pre-peptidase C-terminal domain-containing protein n=1 Tax=Aeromonas TaxID=642 RepID=UPI0012F09672|nr:pre-peptidase C-terminal domain-containing protein [Aeromonas salmonicida]VXA79913.1 exported hypothetical protein [Aeromonas salmonicida]
MKKTILLSAILTALSTPAFALDPNKLESFGEVQTGQFISSPFAQSSAASPLIAPMPPLYLDGIGEVTLNITETKSELGRTVLSGALLQKGVPVPYAEVVLVETDQGGIMASIEALQGKWLIMSDETSGEQYLIKRHQFEMDDEIIQAPGVPEALANIMSMENSVSGDRDPEGNIVIDVLMGFSEKAMAYVQDKDAYALMQIATVNNALRNSKIEGIKVRLVGTGTTPMHEGMSSHQLSKLDDWFANAIAQYSPDIVAGIMLWDDTNTYPNQAGGWGYVSGNYNINEVRSVNAFRHELGHNIGGSHCFDGSGYNFGYDNGKSRTHMCGNDINYYSNPEVTDFFGLPIGNPNTANMARVWRENAATRSSYRPAVVPFDGEKKQLLADIRGVNIGNGQWYYAPVTIPSNAKRVVVITNEGPASKDGGVTLYGKFGTTPTWTDYDARSGTTHTSFNQAIGINNPTPGQLYIGVFNNSSYSVEDMQLQVFIYTEEEGGSGDNTLLKNGQTVTSLAGNQGNEHFFMIDIPAGASKLKFALSGGTGDADLYVRAGAAPTTSLYDYRPYLSGNNETVSIDTPQATRYYAMIRAYSSYSGAQLTASYEQTSNTFESTEIFKIPDNNMTGITSTLAVNRSAAAGQIEVKVDIEHKYRGDLAIKLIAPDGTTFNLKNADNTDNGAHIRQSFYVDGNGITSPGQWQLHVADQLAQDTGELKRWSLTFK